VIFLTVQARPHVPRPFVDADGEVGSTSEAGDLDSMDSDKEEPPEFNDRSMAAGESVKRSPGLLFIQLRVCC